MQNFMNLKILKYKKSAIFPFFLVLLIIACSDNQYINKKNVSQNNILSEKINSQTFLDSLQYKSFLYFLNEINPENGLVRDRSTKDSPASIAAVGFAFPIWAVGAEHGWFSRKEAASITLTSMKFFMNCIRSTSPDATGFNGFYYHFLEMKTGKRTWNCELSSIDTGLLIAGIRFAAQYYNQNSVEEIEIRQLADSLTYRVKWDWFTLPDSGRFASTLSLGWRPEQGFSKIGWVGYNEALIMYIIAAGSGYKGAYKAYQKWLSFYDWRNPYPDIEFVSFPPLFGNHYSHAFIDFRGLADEYMQEKGLDYFENARRATIVQQRYAIENPMNWTGYDSLTWGLTACDGPGASFNTNNRKFQYYSARGTSGPDLVQNDDGTISPTAAAGSIVFAPEIVIPTLESMYIKYGPEGLWGKYGFYDAFNPTANWYGKDYIAINQAPIILMIEYYKTGMIWEYMKKDPIVQKGLKVLKFNLLP